jgi:iron complex transport system substrate-binding protein
VLALGAGAAGVALAAGWLPPGPLEAYAGLAIALGVGAAIGAGLGLGLRAPAALASGIAAAGVVLAWLAQGHVPAPADAIPALLGGLPGLALLLGARALVGRGHLPIALSGLGLVAVAVAAALLLPREARETERGPLVLSDPGIVLAADERRELEGLGAPGLELLRAIDRLNGQLRLAASARDPAALRGLEESLRSLHAEMRRRVSAGTDPDRFRGFLALQPRLIALLARAERAQGSTPHAKRIASLSPANTEILFALGCGGAVVLRDPVSAFPPEVRRLPASNPFQLSVEHLAGFRPDLVLLSHVDSVRLRALRRLGLHVETFDARSLPALFADIETIGRLCGAGARARELVAALRARAERVARAVAGRRRPRVYIETDGSEPLKPWVAGPGAFVDHLLGLAGGETLFPRLERGIAQVNVEQIVSARPEVVLLMNVERGKGSGLARLRARPVFAELEAVRAGRVIDSIDPDLLSRPGPRALDGLELLARALHPDAFGATP